jgi:hypothetical protein
MSTCSGLSALDHANTKFSRGYGSTGAGMGLCARHEFIQRNGAGDLQKGERYIIFGSLWCFYADITADTATWITSSLRS